jgi:hypothetical protein
LQQLKGFAGNICRGNAIGSEAFRLKLKKSIKIGIWDICNRSMLWTNFFFLSVCIITDYKQILLEGK